MTPPTSEAAAVAPGLGADEAALAAPPLALDGAVRQRSALIAEVAEVWRPFWTSRLLVWLVGCGAMLLLGLSGGQWTSDPTNLTTSFGWLGNLLAAPSVRWDSVYYLQIAQHGYSSIRLAGFYPLYPLVIRIGSLLTGSLAVSGVLVSLTAMVAALVIIRRLTTLELGKEVADLTVWLISFGPMALFLSAVYTESLFLALSAGTFYAARRGRWAVAGILGGLAAMERSGGVLLAVPVLMLFLWGPRTDREPRPRSSRWRPRYELAPGILWTLLIPLGAAGVSGYFALRGYGLLAAVHAQEVDEAHDLVLPWVGVGDGVAAAWHQLWDAVMSGGFTNQDNQSLFQGVTMLVSLVALVGVFRRLPAAYGVYTFLGLIVLHASSPAIGEPLAGFARYASLRFPLFMFAAAWAAQGTRRQTLLIVFGLLLVLFTAQFATWNVVGTPML